MWVPVDTARRTVRSGRSPYISRLCAVAVHSSVRRSTTPSSGWRATMAPLSAPTLVPSTRSGTMSRSSSARSMPTSTAPRTPPPPSTNAVVTGGLAARGGGGGGGRPGPDPGGGPVLGPEAQDRDGAADQGDDRERQVPALPARELEGGDQEDHVEPAVGDAEVGGD